MSDSAPDVSISPVRKVFLSGASVIWIVPLLALLVALFVAWQSYNDRGPLIYVEFQKGTGIAAKETELKFRDITVGVVEKVGFTERLEKVVASIRVDKDVAPYIDSGASFWVVQPEVSAQGITGLTTVLSGVYIEGSWDEEIGEPLARFQGAPQAPLITADRPGLEIAFRSTASGYLTDNAPILYRGIEVGRVGQAKIDPRRGIAVVEALIYEEHRSLVSEGTRFWDASGFSVNIGPAGAEIDFSSLATLVGGGITFDTFLSGGDPIQDGTVFQIFPDQETARNSVFNASEVEPLQIGVIFDDNISGLVVGADVELNGLPIGKVETLSGLVDYDQFGDSRVRLNAILSIQPARLGLPGDVTAENALRFLEDRVSNGMRARLVSGSLLTGGLKIELVMVDDPPAARLTSPGATDLPLMPTTESDVADTAATVEGVFNRINNLPIEDVLNSAISLMNSIERFVSNEDLQEAPRDVRVLLSEIGKMVSSDEVRNIPVSINATLTRIEDLVSQLEEQQLAQKLVTAIDTVTQTAGAVSGSLEGVDQLVLDLQGVARKAEALAIEDLVSEVTTLLGSANALLASEDTLAVPRELREALGQVNASLAELREAGVVTAITGTLGSAQAAADNIAAAAAELPQVVQRVNSVLNNAASATESISTSVEGVPALIETLQSVARKADALAVEDLIAELTSLVGSADALLASEDTLAVPRELREALGQVNTSLAELRAAGAINAINETLAAARVAATNVATGTEGLPEVAERLRQVLDDAASATRNIETAAAGVPALIEDIRALVAKADSLEVEAFLAELTELTATADDLLGTEDAAALPGAVKRALDEVNFTLQALREGGTVENVNATLASARNAADNVAGAAQSLPDVLARLNRVLEQAGTTIQGYDRGDQLSRSAEQTLREIRQAADALASLARTIERNPNSLLLGR